MAEIWQISGMYGAEKAFDEIHGAYRDAIAADMENAEKLLELATDYADAGALQILFDAGVSPMYMDRYSHTLLHLLARRHMSNKIPENGVADCVNLLLDNRVSVLRKDENEYMCCYHYAARNGDLDFIRALIVRNAKIDMTGKDGATVLHELAAGFQYNGANTGRYPELAARYVEMANMLIDAGLDVDAKNDYGRTAGDIVMEYKSAGLFRVLVSNPTVFQAIELKSYDDIRDLGATDANTICDEKYGRFAGLPPLGAACASADDTAVSVLFELGADANFKNDNGDMAPVAMFGGQNFGGAALTEKRPEQILDLFIKNGWDINASVNSDGDTLLAIAIKRDFGSTGYNSMRIEGSIINWLMAHGADVNVANNSGITPLMYACGSDAREMENVLIGLLESGADVLARDGNGKTALHYCAMSRGQSSARNAADLLFSFGKIDVNVPDNNGKTALDIATDNNHEELVKYLLTKV